MDNGSILNVKFHPTGLSTEEKRTKIAHALETYFAKGGFQCQFNVVSREVLEDAQKNPDNYRTLVVKVADLVASIQNLRKSGKITLLHARSILMSKGDVFNIQRFSLDDGAGIRTIVFLQGCNLHCPWCHNPESIDGKPVIMRNNKCTACGRCVAACPERCIRVGEKHFIDRERCTLCGKCAEACFEDALTICGK